MERAGMTTPVSRSRSVSRSLPKSRPGGMKWSPRRLIIKSPLTCPNKSVFLHKWWLVMVNGKDLAVGGFTQRDQRVSLFCSAAIAQRHDTTTLETVDGMTIMFSGLIDQLRTTYNGFPNEVCHRFMLGFPLDWDKHSNYCSKETTARTSTSDKHRLHSGGYLDNVSSISLCSVPAAKIHDLMFGLGDDDNNLLMEKVADDMLKMLDKTSQGAAANSEPNAKGEIGIEKGEADFLMGNIGDDVFNTLDKISPGTPANSAANAKGNIGVMKGATDLLMENIVDDMLKSLDKTSEGASANTETNSKGKIEVKNGAEGKTCSEPISSTRVERAGKTLKRKEKMERSDKRSKAGATIHGTSITRCTGVSTRSMSRGVSTRSMTRLMRLES